MAGARVLNEPDVGRTGVERPKKPMPGRSPGRGDPSFKFRLERVRSLRERAEEAAREELARELNHRVRGEALLREATRRSRPLTRPADRGR